MECLDSFEVFYTFYWGMVLICSVIHVFSFEVWSVAVEPPSLVRMGSIRVSAVFYRSTLTLLLLGKRRRGGERRTTPVWASPNDLRRVTSGGIRV
jgi:hypothetical protein